MSSHVVWAIYLKLQVLTGTVPLAADQRSLLPVWGMKKAEDINYDLQERKTWKIIWHELKRQWYLYKRWHEQSEMMTYVHQEWTVTVLLLATTWRMTVWIRSGWFKREKTSCVSLNSPPGAARVFQLCPPRCSLPCQRLPPYHEGLQTITGQSANHSPPLASYTGQPSAAVR